LTHVNDSNQLWKWTATRDQNILDFWTDTKKKKKKKKTGSNQNGNFVNKIPDVI
jgi:hypothetical protein